MHIAILETGRTNKKMPAYFINYPDMFGTLFGCFDFIDVYHFLEPMCRNIPQT